MIKNDKKIVLLLRLKIINMDLKYKIFGSKGVKPLYYAQRYLTLLIPNFFYRFRRGYLLRKFEKMSESERAYILDRVDYYCKLKDVEGYTELDGVKRLSDHKLRTKAERGYSSPYFFDTYEYTRSLPLSLKWAYFFGDVNFVTPIPAVTKSRPIGDHNVNSVILKLNKLRHFIFVDDSKKFEDKSHLAVFRGDINGKPVRLDFVSKYHNSKICDTGDVSSRTIFPPEWHKPKMTIPEQLDFKFILALEGNDVASNLKWVMSTNSVAVMPRPRRETWFMEGRLIPNYHYIEISSDLENLEERILYYRDHPQEAMQIARNANEYCKQFLNRQREEIISHLVLQKFFKETGQGKI